MVVAIDQDSPAARDFLSLLPLTLSFEDYAGKEKISYLPRPLDLSGSAGSKPQVGNLSYYSPWGNVIFYYDADGLEYSDQTVRLGTYTATPEQLAMLEGGNVTVEIVP